MTLPPGPPGRLRNTYRVLSDCFRHYPRWTAQYGDPFTLDAINGTIVLTAEPALIKQIFGGDPRAFDPFGVEAAAPLSGGGSLLILSGERHKHERKLLMPPFHGARMRAYGDAMLAATEQHLRPASEPQSFQALAQRVSLDVIIRTVFGVDQAERIGRYTAAVTELIDSVNPLFLFMPFLQRELGGLGPFARFRKRLELFDTLLLEEVRRVRETGGGEDILSLMVAARYDDGSAMTDDAICDELRTLLIAGHETTALGLCWAVDLLHRHPAALEQALAEVDALGPEPSAERLAGLDYVDAVCKEALRLYPVLTEVLRTLREPFSLGEYELNPGTVVAANIVMAHRNPEVFPEPEAFRPERFLERRFSPFEYLPFGGGHRRCIGAAFASYEMKIVLGSLLSRCTVKLQNREPPRPVRRNITVAPKDGVPVQLSARVSGARVNAA